MSTFYLPALAGLLFVGTAAHAEDLPSNVAVSTADQLTPAPSQEEQPMISQGDPSVRTLRLGNTTVQKAGCLVMSLYDALRQTGITDLSPAAFVQMLSSEGLFTSSGKLRWTLGQFFPVWTQRLTLLGTTALRTAADKLSQGAQVLLEVATDHGTRHWVRIARIVNGDAEIRDPNGGRVGWLSDLYGLKSVRGMAILETQ